jgi:hypothetical protein
VGCAVLHPEFLRRLLVNCSCSTMNSSILLAQTEASPLAKGYRRKVGRAREAFFLGGDPKSKSSDGFKGSATCSGVSSGALSRQSFPGPIGFGIAAMIATEYPTEKEGSRRKPCHMSQDTIRRLLA